MNEDTSDMRDDDDNDSEPSQERGANEPGTETPAMPVAAPLPRTRARTFAEPIDVPLSPFGAVPQGVTHWGLRRRTMGGDWEPLSWSPPGAKAANREWPTAELSEDTIQERWGAGTYEVQWIRLAPRGGRNVLRGGRQVEILRSEPVAPAAASSARTPTLFDQLGDAFKLMNLFEERGDQSFLKVAKMAELIGSRAPTGPTFEEIRALLRDEREASAKATAEAVRLAVEPLQKQIAEWAEEEEEEEENGGLVSAGAAAAQGSKLFRGRKWWQVLGNYATEHPEVIEKVAPVALGALNNVTSALATAMTPPRRPVATVVADDPTPPPPPRALHGDQPNGGQVHDPERVVIPPEPGAATAGP